MKKLNIMAVGLLSAALAIAVVRGAGIGQARHQEPGEG